MEILTEFDELQAALAKVNMDESVLPYVNGKLVDDGAFNKTQKILNCPEMISAHKYLYNLDLDQLTEEDMDKIDQLYKLGCDRGFIIDDLTKWDEEDGEEAKEDVEVAVEKPVDQQPKNTLFKAKIPCWTVIYSATKDGDIKTGEAYSNAVSINAAKADVNAKLSQCGYENITILAIENCMNAPKSPAMYDTKNAISLEVSEADKDDESSDDVEDSSDDDSADDTADDTSSDSDDASDDSSNEDSEDSSNDDSSDDEATNDVDNSSNDDSSDDEATDDDSSDDEATDDDSNDDEATDDDSNDDEATDDDSNDDASDDSNDDDEESDDASDSEDNEESDDKEDDSIDDEDDEELDPNEKAELRDLYRKTFKNTLVKCKFDTSFNDLTLEQKVKFFTELSKAWKKENEPQDFMTDKEIEQLNNVVAQKKVDED